MAGLMNEGGMPGTAAWGPYAISAQLLKTAWGASMNSSCGRSGAHSYSSGGDAAPDRWGKGRGEGGGGGPAPSLLEDQVPLHDSLLAVAGGRRIHVTNVCWLAKCPALPRLLDAGRRLARPCT